MDEQKKKRQHGGRRPGAGRPRRLINPVALSTSVSRETLAEIDTLAVQRRQSRAELLRDALLAYLRKHIVY